MNEKWELIKAHFGPEKEYIGEGYYRVRESEQGWQIAYLLPGYCGETILHPEITISESEKGIIPIRLIDMEVTPILNLDQSEQEKLNEEFEKLLDKFLAAKELTV